MNLDLDPLLEDSQQEGFRFLTRLSREYLNGENRFDKPSEGLYGVFNEKDVIVGIGGINIDPYSKNPRVGRVRRTMLLMLIGKAV